MGVEWGETTGDSGNGSEQRRRNVLVGLLLLVVSLATALIVSELDEDRTVVLGGDFRCKAVAWDERGQVTDIECEDGE